MSYDDLWCIVCDIYATKNCDGAFYTYKYLIVVVVGSVTVVNIVEPKDSDRRLLGPLLLLEVIVEGSRGLGWLLTWKLWSSKRYSENGQENCLQIINNEGVKLTFNTYLKSEELLAKNAAC
jgi:hypothetical protein